MAEKLPTGTSLAESQFYARTSASPTLQRQELREEPKSDEIYSSPPPDDTYHDAIDDLSSTRDPILPEKGKHHFEKAFLIRLCLQRKQF